MADDFPGDPGRLVATALLLLTMAVPASAAVNRDGNARARGTEPTRHDPGLEVPFAPAPEPAERGLCARRRGNRCFDARGLGWRNRRDARPIIQLSRAHVFGAGRIHADDTTVKVLAKFYVKISKGFERA